LLHSRQRKRLPQWLRSLPLISRPRSNPNSAVVSVPEVGSVPLVPLIKDVDVS
jgi:hypothetical protein